jgi:hypothetical protein
MESLKTRILIQHVEGATIAYLSNREAFDLLNIKKDKEDGSQFIEVGNKIVYNKLKYIVKEINFKMENELRDMDHGYGISIDSPNKHSNYNCQVGIFVDNE